jgi:ABC-type amino acid transport substrate-binding protein
MLRRDTFSCLSWSEPMRSFSRILLVAIVLLFLPLRGFVSTTTAAQTTKLTVNVATVAPFAMKNETGSWENIGIDLWRALAGKLKLSYDLVEVPKADLVAKLKTGEVDAIVGGFVVTLEREQAVDLTQVFYVADFAIGVPRKTVPSGPRVLLDAFLSWQFLQIVLAVLGALFAIGVIMYILERKRNPEDFGGKKSQGLLYGLYWSAAMVTGVGANAPRTGVARVIALLWVFAGLFLTSSFTASMTRVLTSELLIRRIQSERDLPRQHVAILSDGYEKVLRDKDARLSVYNSPQDAIGAVVRGDVDACVMSEPVLKYYAGKFFKGKLDVIPLAGERRLYAIGLAPKSPLRKTLNIALLGIGASPEWVDILHRYLSH